MAKFNLYGMCILRDVFGLIPKSEHEVGHFLQWTSPVTNFIYNKKPSRTMELKHFGHDRDKPNFKERCILHDYNRTVLDYFENKADYFMIDLVMLVHTSLYKEILVDGSEHYFTCSATFLELVEEGLKKNFFDKSSLKFVNALSILEEIGYEKVIDEIIRWLVEDKKYNENQIIVMENQMVNYYTDGNSLFELGCSYDKENEILRKCYDYFKKKCPGCHVIKMPINVYADLHHCWGLSDLHFCIEYYQYLYKCIDAIVKKEGSVKELEAIYDNYSRYFANKTIELMKNSFQYSCGQNLISSSFSTNIIEGYIAPKGALYYDDFAQDRKALGELKETIEIKPYGENGKFTKDNTNYFVDMNNCVHGYSGNAKMFCNKWRTVNTTTEVQLDNNSVVITHNGTNENFQCNVIQVVDDNENLQGKPIVFSVYARVLKLNDDGKGGTIAVINANEYNRGIFMAHKTFENMMWERIYVTTRVPVGERFKGLSVCLRAMSSSRKGDAAIVEFRDPKLEIGAFPTAM